MGVSDIATVGERTYILVWQNYRQIFGPDDITLRQTKIDARVKKQDGC
jgi:hypothetical protein